MKLTNKVKDHFLNPRNVGRLDGATMSGSSGNSTTGSGLKVFVQLEASGAIQKLNYQVFNNAPAIAPASAFSEIVVGKTLSEATGIDRGAIMRYLDCDEAQGTNLRYDVLDAFANAVANLHGEQPATPEMTEGGTVTPDSGTSPLASPAPVSQPQSAAGSKPTLILMQLIQDVLDTEIRPAVAMDGGDVELVDVKDKQVHLRMQGHCVGCSSSGATMRFFIEERLRSLVDPALEVVDVTGFEGATHAPPGNFQA